MHERKSLFFLLLLLSFSSWGGAQNGGFVLLSEKLEGIVYQKDPCSLSSFSLVFSFSEDIQDVPKDEVAFIDFSKSFRDFLKSSHRDMSDVALYASAPQKIGNRQLEVKYVAKKVLEDGDDQDFDLPEQIEVRFLDEDVSRISDIYHRDCHATDTAEVTLINKNPQKDCAQ